MPVEGMWRVIRLIITETLTNYLYDSQADAFMDMRDHWISYVENYRNTARVLERSNTWT